MSNDPIPCKVIPLTRLLVSGKGEIVSPLCDSCKTKNCGNPIERKPVSILGKVEYHRLHNSTGIVVQCEGYSI